MDNNPSGKNPTGKDAGSEGLKGKPAAAPQPVGKAPMGKSPAAENPFAEQIGQLEQQLSAFHERIRMTNVTRTVSDVESRILTLPNEIEKLRSRGYAYSSFLENKAEVLQQHWDEMKHRVHQAIEDEVASFRNEMDEVETRIRQLGAHSKESDLASASEWVAGLEGKVQAADSRVRSMYETLERDVQSTFKQVTHITWYLDQKDEASFDFLAGESLFLAAKAEWVASGKSKNDPDGILYLTDQRLIFEQKETTGKRLGMFGGKQEQEVEWELPLNTVESVEAENKGMFGGKDMLVFNSSSGQHRQITVEVKGGIDCKFWQKQIQRMVSGDLNNERAIEPDPEMIEKLRNAPTACHVCGGTLPMLVAGQNQMTCEYCGAIIRV